mmetsp:Transcript_60/g.162  ORF Transcript_60/g.162 Transcript_60/m.162 type:complete len:245 (+) Transcript_60:392-1126(+)
MARLAAAPSAQGSGLSRITRKRPRRFCGSESTSNGLRSWSSLGRWTTRPVKSCPPSPSETSSLYCPKSPLAVPFSSKRIVGSPLSCGFRLHSCLRMRLMCSCSAAAARMTFSSSTGRTCSPSSSCSTGNSPLAVPYTERAMFMKVRGQATVVWESSLCANNFSSKMLESASMHKYGHVTTSPSSSVIWFVRPEAKHWQVSGSSSKRPDPSTVWMLDSTQFPTLATHGSIKSPHDSSKSVLSLIS